MSKNCYSCMGTGESLPGVRCSDCKGTGVWPETNPVADVSSKYGAPMGRVDGQPDDGLRLYLRRVPLNSGGYDAGGAYWGLGTPLWTYGDGADWKYLRARDRNGAKALIIAQANVPADQVKFWR